MKIFFKNVSFSLCANVISMLLGCISVLVFPKFLGQKDYAYYQLYLFYMTYAVLSSLGWSDGVYLEIGGKKYEDLDKNRYSTHFWCLLVLQVVFYAIVFAVSCRIVDDAEKRKIICVVCFGSLIIHSRYFLYLVLQATNRIKEYSLIIITERLVSVLLGVCVILLGYNSYYYLILLDVFGRSISLILALFYTRSIVSPFIHLYPAFWKDVKGYIVSGAMVLFATLSSSIVMGIGRYGIERHWNLIAFGEVSLTISISNMAVRCINAVGIVMFPTLRKVNKDNLSRIYYIFNSLLMLGVFFVFCFFKPFVELLSAWLPNYSDSFRYAAILLPACVYDCKNSLLISTYLKTLRKERILLYINIVSVLSSLVGTYVSVFVFESIVACVVIMLGTLMLRSVLGESFLMRTFGYKLGFNIFTEAMLTLIFVGCNWFLGWSGLLLYFMAYLLYVLLLNRNDRRNGIRFPYIRDLHSLI